MSAHFHVTSALNRESIAAHGLDWRRMGAAPGIAGSPVPEQAGCFLAPDEFTADFFVRMNAPGGPVDVWEVSGVRAEELLRSPEGFAFLPEVVPPERLRLIRTEHPHRAP